VLNLKNGESFEGAFYGKVGEDIVFKVKGETNTKKYSINNVKTIVTKNGELHTFDNSLKDDIQIEIENPTFKQDVLLHKSGKKYKGRYITKENDVIIFRLEGEKDIRRFLINGVDIIITNRSGTTVELYYPFDKVAKIEEYMLVQNPWGQYVYVRKRPTSPWCIRLTCGILLLMLYLDPESFSD
tara:strand:- start:1599 stop:2150 length:552 start_codon:yes stop_codon:yes gene_type:complete